MSNIGGYAVARAHPDSRFYHPPPVRRHRQQRQQHREGINRTESRVDPTAGRAGSAVSEEEEEPAALFCRPSSSAARGESCLSNLDRLIEAVTPSVRARNFDEVSTRRLRTPEGDSRPYYLLEDLWESFREWSVYGVGVPLVLNRGECVKQFYVPSLSGIQLYADPARPRRSGEDADAGTSSDKAEVCNPSGLLVFQYAEQEQPHHRKPFYDKILNLTCQFPDLKNYRSCDVSPSSWISVAWYPIYRIPIGPTLQNLDASFLTFHCLSTRSRSVSEPHIRVSSGRKVNGTVSPPKFSVPVFGLASYKLKSLILTPSGTNECRRAANLLQSAGDWLQKLQVNLPDYQFFVSHSTQWKCSGFRH